MQQYHEEGIQRLIADPRTMIGLSDGGAHVNMLCDAGYCTYLLGTWVRERQALTLENAIKRITSEPADFFGIKDRGRLKVGLPADVAIFDERKVGSAKRARMQNDLAGRRPPASDASGGRRIHNRKRRHPLRSRPPFGLPPRPGVEVRRVALSRLPRPLYGRGAVAAAGGFASQQLAPSAHGRARPTPRP